MQSAFSSFKLSLIRHGALLSVAASVPLALALVKLATSAPTLPIEGLGLIAAVFFFTRPTAKNPAAAFLRQIFRQVPSQMIAGGVCIAAGRLFWHWPWNAFVFIPLWIFVLPTVFAVWRLLIKFRRPLIKTARWLAEHSRRLFQKLLARRDDVALTGALGLGIILFLAGRLEPALELNRTTALLLASLWLLLDLAPFARWQSASGPRSLLSRFASRLALWSLLSSLAALTTPAGFTLKTAAWLLVTNFALAGFAVTHLRGIVHGAENARRAILGLGALWLVHPFATHILLGAGDAHWYANTLADFLAQLHAANFPVFVGQSEYLFNGGVFPIRFAPLFQHFGMLIDVITLGTLDPVSVQNTIIIGCLFAAAVSTYFVLRRLLPERPGLACALTLLYLSCPGVLALAHFADLLMSWTTLPWLPVAFGGSLLAFRERGPIPYLLMSGGLGLLWWGHSPIAIWSTLAVAFAQLARLIIFRPRPSEWRDIALAAVIFGLLMAYPLVSVLVVPIDPATATSDYAATKAGSIYYFINESFPGIIRPLDPKNPSLAFFQPGWALLLLISFCLLVAVRGRIRHLGFWATLTTSIALLLVLLPIPYFTSLFWTALPGFLRNPTGSWPMQRFNAIIAVGVVCAAVTLASLSTRRTAHLLGWLLLPAVLWSFWESKGLVQAKDRQRREIELRPIQRLPENNTLTRYAYLVFARPPAYFSHGYVEPLFENRLFERATQQALPGNPEAVTSPEAGAKLLQAGPLIGTQKDNNPLEPWSLSPSFRLEPNLHYALEIDFTQPSAEGVLIMEGPTLNRVYALPSYGGTLSFGSAPGSSHIVPLSTSGRQPEEITLRFVAQGKSTAESFSLFGRYRWFEVNLGKLPINVTGWIPYQARVQSPSEAWLETPRMFQPGYHATVDGRLIAVARSPEGLVMVPVPAGPSQVTLSYRPPPLLLSSYWLSFATIVGLALTLVTVLLRSVWPVTVWPTPPAKPPALP